MRNQLGLHPSATLLLCSKQENTMTDNRMGTSNYVLHPEVLLVMQLGTGAPTESSSPTRHTCTCCSKHIATDAVAPLCPERPAS